MKTIKYTHAKKVSIDRKNRKTKIVKKVAAASKGVRKKGAVFTRNLFSHGNSKAVNLPKQFIDLISYKRVQMRIDGTSLIIDPVEEMDNIETDPEFEAFIQAIAKDALKHPKKLVDITEMNGELWDLVKDVSLDEEI